MKINHHITADDAKAALVSIAVANEITANSMRPPVWLILLCALALGIKTAAMGFMINNGFWNSIQWGTYSLICLSIISWIVALRMKGITIKITDVNVTTKGVIAALFICVLLVLSRAIYLQTGGILFPCIAGMLNAFILASSLRFGQLFNAKGMNTKDKERSNG